MHAIFMPEPLFDQLVRIGALKRIQTTIYLVSVGGLPPGLVLKVRQGSDAFGWGEAAEIALEPGLAPPVEWPNSTRLLDEQ